SPVYGVRGAVCEPPVRCPSNALAPAQGPGRGAGVGVRVALRQAPSKSPSSAPPGHLLPRTGEGTSRPGAHFASSRISTNRTNAPPPFGAAKGRAGEG